ncbi:MAG TPA: OmpA family protein [Cytophagaceae bacterium]|nr:OmpA family protein [Cytophagaceae bacterium]
MNKIILSLFFLLLANLSTFSQDLIPTETQALLECIVTDPDKIPEEGAVVIVESADKTFSKQGVSDIDGKFKLLAPEGKKYNIKVKKFGKDFFFTVELPVVDGPSEFTQHLRIKLVKFYVRGYTLDHMYFDTNKWDIKPEAIPTLTKLYDSFVKNPKLVVEIGGHTDNVGEADANLRLSQHRADAIRDYLIKKGVSADRILSKGYGEHTPIASNDTDAGRAKNRRTEVKVIEE